MTPVEKEARTLVSGLLNKAGYICAANDILLPGTKEWPKLPGLVALVTDLLGRPVFVPPDDPDELAVWKIEAGRPNRWRKDQTLDMVKEYWPDTFSNLLRLYRAGKEAARG